MVTWGAVVRVSAPPARPRCVICDETSGRKAYSTVFRGPVHEKCCDDAYEMLRGIDPNPLAWGAILASLKEGIGVVDLLALTVKS